MAAAIGNTKPSLACSKQHSLATEGEFTFTEFNVWGLCIGKSAIGQSIMH